MNFTTPHGEEFFFQGADIPAAYDLVNWQTTTDGSLKLVLIGRVDGLDIDFNKSTIQWTTGSSQVVNVNTFLINIVQSNIYAWLIEFYFIV